MNKTKQEVRSDKRPAKQALNLRFTVLDVRRTVDSANSKALHREK